MKVALIQMNAGPEKDRNLQKAQEFIRQAAAKKAQWVLLPEVFLFRRAAGKPRQAVAAAEKVPGPSIRTLMGLAADLKLFILAGSVHEKVSGKRKVYNTSVLIGPKGNLIARYRKRRLFEAGLDGVRIRESDYFLPGRRSALCRAASLRVGMSICYDLRFPELYRAYARKGCDVFTVPSAFTHKTGKAHWEALLRARAIENLCYVLAPNQTGTDGQGVRSYGNSMVVGPWGDVLARASAGREEVIYAGIDRKEIDRARRKLPAGNPALD